MAWFLRDPDFARPAMHVLASRPPVSSTGTYDIDPVSAMHMMVAKHACSGHGRSAAQIVAQGR